MDRGIGSCPVPGQAMTEFLICATFVLIPLFLGIPLLAKYIDIKHATIQAARYQAWEYTVWYNDADNNDILDNFNAVSATPIKSAIATRKEARRRFFSDFSEKNTLEITASDGGVGWQSDVKNQFWHDHRGLPLYDGSEAAGASLNTAAPTPTVPIIGDVLNIMLDVLDFAFSAIGSLLQFLGSNVGFSAINTDGYAKATVAVPVATSPAFINTKTLYGDAQPFFPNNLIFTASAGVLTDGWNAGGVKHTYNQAGGTVPSVMLKELLTLPGLAQVWDVIAILAPELRRCHPSIPALPPFGNPDFPDDKGSLWLGHIDIDAVHPDRLSEGGTHTCDDAGICVFEPNVPPPPKDCIP